MQGRQRNESLSKFAIRVAWEYGHFWNPLHPEGRNIRQNDLKKLKVSDPIVVEALISFSKMDSTAYTRAALDHHGRKPDFDGQVGPAMETLLDTPRCPVPDFAPPIGVEFQFDDPDLQEVVCRMQADTVLPAVGAGNWARCHGVGDFHCASVGVDDSGLPSFLRPLWKEVLTRVQKAYAQVGLLFWFVDKRTGKDIPTGRAFSGNINSDMSFQSSSSGWIGLAIVGRGEQCGSRIWCKFLSTYRGGNNDQSIVTQWTSLVKHELGHNCGRSHTNGGVMNPSIVNGLPPEWAANDPSTSWLKGQFGGVPVPIPGGDTDNPDPDPPSDFESRLAAVEISDVVQDVTIDWLVTQVNRLKGSRS